MPTTVAVDAAPLLGRPTGVGVAVDGLLRGLAGRPELRLVAYGLTGTGPAELPRRLPPGAPAVRRPMPARLLLPLWARAELPTVELWTGAVDVVHGTNFVVPPTRRAARLVTVHDLTPLHHPELCTPASLRYPVLVRRAVARGAHVHVPSHFVAAEMAELVAGAGEQIHVIPWGVAVPEPTPLTPGAPYVLALGTAEPRKDLPLLVRAFDALADDLGEIRLRLAGPVGWGEDELAAAIAGASHRDRIERLGWVADTGPLLAGAAVFAYPSRYEGFGFPPLEAMARGVPVVATAAGAVPEVVGDAAELVPVGDVDALTAALARVLTDVERRRALVEAGHRRVGAYSWAATAEAMAALYRHLA